MTSDPEVNCGPVIVTPGGHDPLVWEPTLQAAPHVRFEELVHVVTRGVTGPSTLVVAGAHPDDETLGLGRLAYAWAQQVGPVTGVLATAGEACVDHVLPRPPGIAARRLAEWQTAVGRLGFTDRHLLDLPDGHLAEHEDALAERLSAVVTAAAPGPVVLAAPWRGDPHPDHRAVGRAAARAVTQMTARTTGDRSVLLLEFPVWMTYWSEPASAYAAGHELLVVQHDPASDLAHREATLAFASQLRPLAPNLSPVVPAAMLEHQRRQLLLVEPALVDQLAARP